MNAVVVFISDQDNPEHGTVRRFESVELAERFVESQVESGAAVEALNVFAAIEIPVAVNYRPVVTLTPAGSSAGDAPATGGAEAKPYERDGQRLSSALPDDD